MQGLLLINKPENMTSFSAVARIKRIAAERRVGHTGTLDPMATGVLPILLGRATALSAFLLDADKRYTARIKLGVTTDTCDITGNVLQEKNVDVTEAKLVEAVSRFVGKIEQTPPAYSAIKVGGERLYKLAREGKQVEIPSRQIEVYSADIISALDTENCFEVDFKVSKGTYIRSLARDIGEVLGCGATLASLCRTSAHGFDLKDCIDLNELTEDNIGQFLLNADKAVENLRSVSVTDRQAARFLNGGQLAFDRLKTDFEQEDELVRVKYQDELIGIGRADIGCGQLAVKCILKLPQTLGGVV